MGNGTSRVVGCFVPFNGKGGVDLDFLEPLDEGIGHSFCYVRPSIFDSPAITPSNSERFTVDSSTLDSETLSGSFRHDCIDDPTGLHRPNCSKGFPETTFKTISGASVSANVSTARTGNHSALFASDAQEPAASFESTASFAAIPLQPVPRGSGPLNGFMSGPLERGFASGPLDRGAGFMSGPIEKGVFSGPLDSSDKSNFSAPLARGRRRPRFQQLMRSVSGPMRSTLSRTFSKRGVGSGWMQRFFLHSVTQFAWHTKEAKFRAEAQRNCVEGGPSESEYGNSRNLQWAHGKAGEDRVHVVLSEEQGWLFIGIYDGFSGPDAPEFLMSHLYRAIDKELEGLLWDYEDKSQNDPPPPLHPDNGITEIQLKSHSDQLTSGYVVESCNDAGISKDQSSHSELVEESSEILTHTPTGKLNGQGRKSMRLYELLQMESLILKEDDSTHHGADPTTSGGDLGVGLTSDRNNSVDALSVSEQKQTTRKSVISSKIKNMYKKQKSLRKKLFRWSYDWHREETCFDDKMLETSGPIRRCKSGIVNHDAVLKAMARALEKTEEAYMEMVEQAFDTNPELALMGSCVLVMLMKDQDVYVMNLGDSRAILAQERQNDRHPNMNFGKDDLRHRNRSRESLVRMELDRISEESPMHNQNCQINMMNKNRDISICRLKMRAIQLSTDHSTSVEEVCFSLYCMVLSYFKSMIFSINSLIFSLGTC